MTIFHVDAETSATIVAGNPVHTIKTVNPVGGKRFSWDDNLLNICNDDVFFASINDTDAGGNWKCRDEL